MAEQPDDQDPIEQLVDLFVYAPIGLLYEYDEVMERLVKRGKSQVQLAKVMGQLAVSGRRAAGDAHDVADFATSAAARVITEIGSLIGLAPEQGSAPSEPAASEPTAVVEEPELAAPSLPIANYDDLKAREIIPLLDSLSAEQRAVVRSYEEAERSRKTVLAKLDRLDN